MKSSQTRSKHEFARMFALERLAVPAVAVGDDGVARRRPGGDVVSFQLAALGHRCWWQPPVEAPSHLGGAERLPALCTAKRGL